MVATAPTQRENSPAAASADVIVDAGWGAADRRGDHGHDSIGVVKMGSTILRPVPVVSRRGGPVTFPVRGEMGIAHRFLLPADPAENKTRFPLATHLLGRGGCIPASF